MRVDGRTKDPMGLGFHGTSVRSPLPAIPTRPEKIQSPKSVSFSLRLLLQGVHNPMPVIDCGHCMNQQYKMCRVYPHSGRSLVLGSNVLPRQMIWSLTLLLGWFVVAKARTMQQNATLSGLVFANMADGEEPRWNDQEIPPVLVDNWSVAWHASVVVEDPDNEDEQTIVVLGGWTMAMSSSDLALLWNVGSDTKEWRQGPKMNQGRKYLTAVVCNGWVYAISGSDDVSYTVTNERIRVSDLLATPLEKKGKNWTTLDIRLTKDRYMSAAAVVHDRYIVVAGGYNRVEYCLTTVDIIDTAAEGGPVVFQGPDLNIER